MHDDAASFASRLATVRGRIERAARSVGRDPGEIRLIAVSKTFPVVRIREALAAGCRDLGESRAQELTAKAAEVADLNPRWVFLGPVQTNKARDVARWAHEVQSLERIEVATALQRRLETAERTLDVLLQVNTSGEASKSGVASSAVVDLARQVMGLDRLRIRGLMTIATLGGDEAETRRCFRELVRVQADLRQAGVVAPDLSMGMSGDLELAIAEGATTLRVGTALFGGR